ncbi:MAG: IS30 family transposase [Candidatus Nanopelagicales bacterium]
MAVTSGRGAWRYSWQRRAGFFADVCSGVSLRAASARLGASTTTTVRWWQESAGMELQMGPGGSLAQVPPPGGGWVGDKLTARERDEIAVGLAAGLSQAEIARRIGRSASTVSREVRRNAGPDGTYYASVAHAKAYQRSRRPKGCKLDGRGDLIASITEWLDQGWSPKLIAAVLARRAGADHTARVSHETIYQSLYVQARGHLRADLYRCLSTRRSARKSRTATRRGAGPFTEAFTISQRPAEVADRAVPGHWEGDLILGAGGRSAIGTLVERSTRFTILLHLPGRHTAEEVAAAMIAAMGELPDHLRRSITWDRGSELADWRDIQLALNTTLYFCDPHSPWQRGSNENTNRLLRHWFEKGSDLSVHSPAELRRVQDLLNSRPRPTLDLKTPAQALAEYLEQQAA